MEIKKVFGATKEEVESKKFNIFIGISLGNKWFNEDNLREYLRWVLDNTRDRVLFLIVDKLHAINYNVRNKDSEKYNLKRALKKGGDIVRTLNSLVEELSKEERSKIDILRWEDYEEKDLLCSKFTPIIFEKFDSDVVFKDEILNLVKSMIRDRPFSEEDYLDFCQYILGEFITSYSGICFDSVKYEAYFYPLESDFEYFIDKLQNSEIFSELNKILPKQAAVRVILS